VVVAWPFARVVSAVMELTVVIPVASFAAASSVDSGISEAVAPVFVSCITRLLPVGAGTTATLSGVVRAGIPGSVIVTSEFVGEVERVSVPFSVVVTTEGAVFWLVVTATPFKSSVAFSKVVVGVITATVPCARLSVLGATTVIFPADSTV